jgi:hypothetical protein
MKMTIHRDDLVQILKDNRARHAETYQEAVRAYTARRIKLLKEEEARLREGDIEAHFVALPRPEQHIGDYDTVIDMMERNLSQDVVLEFEEYQHMVMDRWHWSGAFAANTVSYTSQKR